ncbi:MAG: sulfatase-like hydrolase/transferase [Planctomycetaceae bacterium]|nr:sulfatase-like hydrolase/transferase [Planctomycetaceae bacterium]
MAAHACSPAYSAEGVRRPNIVIILADDQGWGDLSVHGNSNLATPNIDSLARDGALFDRFFVCQVCAPTRAEFLTGRYHPRTGVRGVSTGEERMNADEVTLADTLKSAGYATGCFGKWHNGTQPPLHPNYRGFDEYYGFTSGHWGIYFDPPLDHNGTMVQGQGFIIDDLTDHAIDFVREHREEPFLCYVPYNTPHSPMQVPDRFYQKFDGVDPQMWNRDRKQEDVSMTRAALAMVENIDWNVGRILETLAELKLADDTIVVYFSDNGPNSWRWNGDMKGRKGSLDEGGLRAPCLVRWPGQIPAGRRIDHIAGAIDLLPTLCDLAGAPLINTKPLDGTSLKPLLTGDAADWPDRVIASFRAGNRNGGVSVRNQSFRLDNQGALFDLTSDPGQRTNVAKQHPDIAGKLSAIARQHASEMEAALAENADRPFHVGYGPSTTLPARDGVPHGGIERSNRAPNDSYFTHWTSPDDRMTWDVDVAKTGEYDVTLTYTCPESDIGSEIVLSTADGNRATAKIIAAFDPPLRGKEFDRSDRGTESFVKEFRPLSLGKLSLKKGRTTLTLRATSIPGQQVADAKYLILKGLE